MEKSQQLKPRQRVSGILSHTYPESQGQKTAIYRPCLPFRKFIPRYNGLFGQLKHQRRKEDKRKSKKMEGGEGEGRIGEKGEEGHGCCTHIYLCMQVNLDDSKDSQK